MLGKWRVLIHTEPETLAFLMMLLPTPSKTEKWSLLVPGEDIHWANYPSSESSLQRTLSSKIYKWHVSQVDRGREGPRGFSRQPPQLCPISKLAWASGLERIILEAVDERTQIWLYFRSLKRALSQSCRFPGHTQDTLSHKLYKRALHPAC